MSCQLGPPAGKPCGGFRSLRRRWGSLLFDEAGRLRDHLHVFLNGRNISTLGGLAVRLSEGDSVAFFPPDRRGLNRVV